MELSGCNTQMQHTKSNRAEFFFFLRKFKSFDVCNEMLCQSVVVNYVFFALVCWGTRMTAGRGTILTKWSGSVCQSLGGKWTVYENWWRVERG